MLGGRLCKALHIRCHAAVRKGDHQSLNSLHLMLAGNLNGVYIVSDAVYVFGESVTRDSIVVLRLRFEGVVLNFVI